jgi:hypothetical protein
LTTSEFGSKSDIYRFDIPEPGAIFVQAPRPVRLTTDHKSSSPLWGPNETIVFVKHLGEKHRQFGPKNLFLMNSSGKAVKRLTLTKVEPLLAGLSPTAWSANGKHLLAEFGGQDTTYAVTVNPKTGAERTLTKEREVGFVGAVISSDGKFVLGSLGGFEPGPGNKVVSIPMRAASRRCSPTTLSKAIGAAEDGRWLHDKAPRRIRVDGGVGSGDST